MVTRLLVVLSLITSNFVPVKCGHFEGSFSPKEAEAYGVREVLNWQSLLCGLWWSTVQVEMSALIVVNELQSNSNNFPIVGLLINNVKELTRNLSNVYFYFVKRSANRATHMLARKVFLESDGPKWIFNPPLFICEAFFFTKNNCVWNTKLFIYYINLKWEIGHFLLTKGHSYLTGYGALSLSLTCCHFLELI